MVPAVLRQVLQAVPEVRPVLRGRVTLEGVFSRVALAPYGVLVRVLEQVAPYLGVRVVAGDLPPDVVLAAEPSGLVEELGAALEARSDEPMAAFAQLLLPYLTSEGFIRETDEALAELLGLDVGVIGSARRWLQREYGVGYVDTFHYWAERLEGSGVPPHVSVVLAVLRRHGGDAKGALREFRRNGIPLELARRVVRRLVRRLGTRPVDGPSLGLPVSYGGGSAPDVVIDVRGPDDYSCVVLSPRVIRVADVDTVTTVATVAIPAGLRSSFVRLLEGLPEFRARQLRAVVDLAMRENLPFLAGVRRYRSPVPVSAVRAVLGRRLGDVRLFSMLYPLNCRVSRENLPMWYLLGYSRVGRRVCHYPLEAIRDALGRVSTVAEAHRDLMAHGVRIPYRTLTWACRMFRLAPGSPPGGARRVGG